MKFTSTCLVVLSLLPSSQAFAPPQQAARPSTVALNEHKDVGGWFGPAAATVAGWTLAAQMAFAGPMVVPEQVVAPTQTSDSTSLLVAAKVEVMDFSMPSYGDAYGGDASSGAKMAPGIPSFNPFGSSEPETPAAEDTSEADAKAAAEAKKAEEKAAAEAKKAQEKAAAEAKKAEEKAAAEAKKAEEEAKRAEKEARRQAELEKQKEAVERAKQKKEQEAAAAAAVKEEEPAAPEFSIPSFSAPEIPDVKLPEVKVPEMPKMSFSLPKIELPEAPEMPKVEAPKVPEFSAPKVPEFSAPKVPEFSAPKVPEFSAPKVPEFSAPKVSIPSFEAPKSSGGYDFGAPAVSSPEDDVEPQEVRDARAKEARSVFLEADNEAKEIEKQARALRDIANEKKKIAKELKDDACKTRFGGKFLCIRPLNSGY